MTYRNDPYDPKQAALLDPAALDDAAAEAEKAFAAASDLDALIALKPVHLGDRSQVSLARREIGALPPAAKSDAGARVNATRTTIQAAFDARRVTLAAEAAQRVLQEEQVDVTLPWDRRPRGFRHPLTTLMEDIADSFVAMGFDVAEGPELESEWYNFDALNFVADHPARTMMDTFYVATAQHVVGGEAPLKAANAESGLVLRTHTSPVQARTMLNRQPPIAIVCPGRVYRTDELDATHMPVFHQVEGLVVDKGITMAHLKGTLGPLRPGDARAGREDAVAPVVLPVHRAVRRVRRVVPAAPRRPALGRMGWLRHGQPARADRVRHRPGRLHRFRVRNGDRPHADGP